MWTVTDRLTIDEHDFSIEYPTHREAYLVARRFACARGAIFVRVTAPDGTLAHEWSRVDNRWIAHAGYPV